MFNVRQSQAITVSKLEGCPGAPRQSQCGKVFFKMFFIVLWLTLSIIIQVVCTVNKKLKKYLLQLLHMFFFCNFVLFIKNFISICHGKKLKLSTKLLVLRKYVTFQVKLIVFERHFSYLVNF